MQVKFKSTLPFIMKDNILEGEVTSRGGGTYVFTTQSHFKQILKQPEYTAMMAANILDPKKQAAEEKKKNEKEEEDRKKKEEQDKEEGKEKEKIERKTQLEAMEEKELVKIAKKLYDNVDKEISKEDIIPLILEAEFEEEE